MGMQRNPNVHREMNSGECNPEPWALVTMSRRDKSHT